MKMLLVFICMLGALVCPLRAQTDGQLGAGVILGDPNGLTAKYWLSGTRALDAGVGFGSDVSLYADYLWHSWEILSQPAEGKIPLYLGLGAQIRTSSPSAFGLRAVGGAAYWLQNVPLEIFLELVPVLNLSSHGNGMDLNAGLGVRYYFNSGK
ncbi:MAG: hypothetical protein A3J79_07610 [Elusimicrobia bacterium RIFOXYB2_FULL_62_6]|nr:MAG: hypothetical protein A3J79_07610 [Elusimicrobia bacterium RIFOXYB2_FULL_62_6]